MPSYLLFFDTNLEAIGAWALVHEALNKLELFPYGITWYEEQALHWQTEGFEVIQETLSGTPPQNILQSFFIPLDHPEALNAFLRLCQKNNWTTQLLSELHYETWAFARERSASNLYQLAQDLSEQIPLSSHAPA